MATWGSFLFTPPFLLLLSFTLSCQSLLFPKEAWPTESGYLVVNQTSGARMFYAYYEALSPEVEIGERALLLWLQGGPGCSGMVGNFYELGPWRVGEDLQLHRNAAPWNRLFGVLFLDNPVGTGFSIAPTLNDVPTEEDDVARDVYIALQGFFDRHRDFRTRPFYVTGESYAGKYVPAVGSYILRRQSSNVIRSRKLANEVSRPLRLDGVAIGNGLTHPEAQVLMHAPTAYFMGLIDEVQKSLVEERANTVVSLIAKQYWNEAGLARDELLEYIKNVSGLATLYDVRRTRPYYTTVDGVDILSEFLNKEEVKRVLKVKVPKWESCSEVVGQRMQNDIAKSTKDLVEYLLHRVPVLLYQGQMDLRDGVASTEAWMQLIEWSEINSFFASEKKVWVVDSILAGYVRSYKSLTHVVISNAGHFVPADQNYHSQLMIENWIAGKSLA
eukprot:c28455_g1_i2 orf=480-1808(-)